MPSPYQTPYQLISYWVLTFLFLLPAAGTGIFELFLNGPQQTVESLIQLGYPLYLMKILGFAKILGALAIVTGRSYTLKEWAYAGFSINFLGATASHLLAGDPNGAPIPFSLFVIMLGSYLSWRLVQKQTTLSELKPEPLSA